jgi:malate dehydrogenase (oxaloacetate-decarboxylating)(NADP+)
LIHKLHISKDTALDYHNGKRPGKVEIIPTKPFKTQFDLSLAYTPGVAYPCLEIEKEPNKAYDYTSKSNLVAVISNGTAVLGLGDIGALAGKPVMEGKGILFKRFADIDVFDIEVNEKNPDRFIEIVKAISVTFGGINLEDIKAPECFYIEKRLKKETDIPIFHDDQHGTAIVAAAGLLNALYLAHKDIDKVKIVISGAGASAISTAKLLKKLGARNIIMTDSKGVLRKDRTDLNEYKREFAIDTDIQTLEEAMKNADIFIGLSRAGIVSKEMVRNMARNPIIFAMANPTPEIMPEEIEEVRDDAIIATGRSDYPNQVNNVLAFPFIFRGALDIRATSINEDMKVALVYALARLARENVPYQVKEIYGEDLFFSKNYLIPKPFDERLILTLPIEVAKAGIRTGVARINNFSEEEYRKKLEMHLERIKELTKCSVS